jgi:hypothetical protein
MGASKSAAVMPMSVVRPMDWSTAWLLKLKSPTGDVIPGQGKQDGQNADPHHRAF